MSTSLIAVLLCLSPAPTGDPDESSWLGVRIETPSPSLASQLKLDGVGFVVVNLADNGPADRGGLQQYDVIVSLNGQQVLSDYEAFGQRVGSLGTAEDVSVVVLRGAEERMLSLRLTPWPEEINWKYELAPQRIYSEDVAVSGKVLRLGPDGGVLIEDLGDVQAMPLDIGRLLPPSGSSTTSVWIEDGRMRSRTEARRDDITIEIEHAADGTIQVRRSRDGQDVQSSTYADSAVLSEQDPEVHGILENARVQFSIKGRQAAAGEDFDPEVSLKRLLEFQEALIASLSDVETQLNQALSDSDAAAERVARMLRRFERNRAAQGLEADSGVHEDGRPVHSFELQTDGSIAVTIRRASAELALTFPNAEALREKMPTLYELYRQLEPSEE